MAPRTLDRPRTDPAADTPVDAHPRMRARRAEVARRAGRARLRRIKVVLALVCVVVWSLVGLRSSLVDVDRVQVVGAGHTSDVEVREAAATPRGTPMVEVDLDGIRRRVAALPWVAEVRATRLWPGTVRVVVTERTPEAIVEHADGWASLDGEGRVLAVTDAPPALPVVAGRVDVAPGGRVGPEARDAAAVVAALPAPFVEGVEEVTTTDDGIELVLSDGYRATFGDGRDVAAKAVAADAVRQHVPEDSTACRIDVRVPSAPVLTTGTGCA